MGGKQLNKKRKLRRILLCLVLVLAVLVGGFLLWAGNYYHADDTALAAQAQDSSLKVVNNMTILSPDTPGDTGIIFYPGAKVEATAYLPLLEKLKADGVTCVLVSMPLNLAIFDKNAADDVYGLLPGIRHWYIAGHSMGGAMASDYASGHQDRVDGLILLGAYIYGSYPPSKALTVYGSLNSDIEKHISYTDNIVKIEGGNHAQFGNYGPQKGDAAASISAEEQQDIAVDVIVGFIGRG
jgi:pimeloyl-ACP methyl ester carboxylesterase